LQPERQVKQCVLAQVPSQEKRQVFWHVARHVFGQVCGHVCAQVAGHVFAQVAGHVFAQVGWQVFGQVAAWVSQVWPGTWPAVGRNSSGPSGR
jgi:hypothetical protein